MFPNPGPYLALFGVIVVLTPMIMIMRKYGPDPETAVEKWMFNEPLERFLQVRAMILSGGGMIMMGLILWAARP